MKYARLSTIKSNIGRSKAYIAQKKRESNNTISKARKLFLAEKIDDEARVLEKLEAAYQAAVSLGSLGLNWSVQIFLAFGI